MRYLSLLLMFGVVLAQEDQDEGVGSFQESVYAVGAPGSYNIMGNLSMWGVGSAMGDSSRLLYMHRVEVDLDMTFDSWLFGFVKAQSWAFDMDYSDFHIPEAYMEAYFADWFSTRMGKQLLFYGDGLIWSDRLEGPPALSLLFGNNFFLNAHFIYSAPQLITDKASLMTGGAAGGNLGPVYLALDGLYKPSASDTGQPDIWAGLIAELDHHPFDLALEGGYYQRDTLNAMAFCLRADVEPGPFVIGASALSLDPRWSNPFNQAPVMYYNERGWGTPGDVYTFGVVRAPFFGSVRDLGAANAHLGYNTYLDFIKPDLVLMTRLDIYAFSSSFTGDSSYSVGNEADLSLHFSVTKTVDFGLTAGYFMASDSTLDDGYSVRTWVAKDFYFE